jgi:hypothetical protein
MMETMTMAMAVTKIVRLSVFIVMFQQLLGHVRL